MTTTALKEAAALQLHAECPHCGASMTTVARLTPTDVPSIGREGDDYDNNHDRGRGAWVTACDSCGERFAIPHALVQDTMHACLVLLGEA